MKNSWIENPNYRILWTNFGRFWAKFDALTVAKNMNMPKARLKSF